MTVVPSPASASAPAVAGPVAGIRLEWAVKASFVAYVEALPDGNVETFGGAIRAGDGRFVFGTPERSRDALAFTGTLRFSGHHGVLDVLLSDPRIETLGAVTALTVAVGAERVHIATIGHLDGGAPSAAIHPAIGSALTGTGVTATDDGAHLLGGVYSAGTPLDDILIHLVAAPAPAVR